MVRLSLALLLLTPACSTPAPPESDATGATSAETARDTVGRSGTTTDAGRAATPAPKADASELDGSGTAKANHGTDAAPRRDPRRADATYWIARTDAELDAAFEATCARARASGKPVLLQFSAPWCPDCRLVRTLSTQAPLRGELDRWETLVIDPGHMDRHVPVLEAFEIGRIVTWIATRPQDCRLPAPSWTRLRTGTFEPATGAVRTGAELAAWLAAARDG